MMADMPGTESLEHLLVLSDDSAIGELLFFVSDIASLIEFGSRALLTLLSPGLLLRSVPSLWTCY